MADTDKTGSWINRLRKREAPQLTDWGDFGTAFGMEMTLVSPVARSEAEINPATHTPAQHTSRWWSRRK